MNHTNIYINLSIAFSTYCRYHFLHTWCLSKERKSFSVSSWYYEKVLYFQIIDPPAPVRVIQKFDPNLQIMNQPNIRLNPVQVRFPRIWPDIQAEISFKNVFLKSWNALEIFWRIGNVLKICNQSGFQEFGRISKQKYLLKTYLKNSK